MNIEFRTVYDNIENEKMGQLYAKYCIDNQLKQLRVMKLVIVLLCLLGLFISIYVDLTKGIFVPFFIFPFIAIGATLYCDWVKKKLYPKTFSNVNGVGCPYNVTFGLYDEYFYEKWENNMSIQESSVRYEFLKMIVETPEYFILMTQRSQLYFLPKRDMGYENVIAFSMFCKARLPYVYKSVN